MSGDHTTTEHEIPHDITIHTGEIIPIYGHHHTNCAMTSGQWNDPTIWDAGVVPNQTDKVCIPIGLTVELEGVADCLDLVITGSFTIKNNASLRVRTITVLATGYLEATQTANIIFKDYEFDKIGDPAMFGHGLLVIDGAVKFEGLYKNTWATSATELLVGQNKITVTSPIMGWKAGDRIVIPHTLQDNTIITTEVATVSSIVGNVITLQVPLTYNHPFWKGTNGATEGFEIGNLNQSITLASENPLGNRAHCLFTHSADIVVKNVAFKELGRTTTAPLNSVTTVDGVRIAGTNQIGRYSMHFHHCIGRINNGKQYQFQVEDCVVESSPKWGIALHSSHFGKVANCFIYDCAGGHIITEDPWVYANDIDNNVIMGKTKGSGQRITDRAHRNLAGGDHWHDRVGLGLQSMMNKITNNRIYGCKEGIGMAGFETTTLYYPTQRGVMAKINTPTAVTLAEYHGWVPGKPRRYPFLFDTSNNKVMGGHRGFETWTVNAYKDYPEKMFPGLKIVHCIIPTDFEDQRETTCYDWQFLGDFSKVKPASGFASDNTMAIFFKGAYEFGANFIRCQIRGYDIAYRNYNASEYINFEDCIFECPNIVYQPYGIVNGTEGGWIGKFNNCKFNKVSGKLMFIGGYYPKYDIGLWIGKPAIQPAIPQKTYAATSSVEITPWIDGRNIKVYNHFQKKSFALASLTDPNMAYKDLPKGCWTNEQFAAAGKPIFGEVAPDWIETASEFMPGYYYIATTTKPMTLEERVADLERRMTIVESN